MGMNWLFKPLTDVGSRLGKKAGEFFNPTDKEPTRLKGFLQGASEGAGRLVDESSSPFSLMMMAAGSPFLKGAMGGAKSLAGPTMDLIDSPVVKQIMPKMDDVDSLIGDMTRNLANIPNRGVAPGINPAMLPPELVHRGGESLYNANRAMHMGNEATRLADVAYEGSKAANRINMPGVASNVDVAKMMEALNRARGKK